MNLWNENTIEDPNYKMHYYIHREGKPVTIIFCHGFMDNGMCYDRVAEQFLNHFDAILIDAIGHGLSSDPHPNATYYDMITPIFDICKKENLKKVIVVGHSMGGVEAALFAAEHSDLVQAVILEDPGFGPKPAKFFVSIVAFFAGLFMRHDKTPGPMSKYEKRSKRMNKKWEERDQLVWAKAQRELAAHYPGQNLKVLFSGSAAKDILPRIKAPILLLTAQGGINKPRHARLFQTWVPSMQWVHVLKSGHNIRREQFEIEIQAIQRFLAENLKK